MPGHDQTDIRRRRRAGTWFFVLGVAVLASALAPGSRPAAAGGDSEIASWKGSANEPILLRGDRVQTWTEGASYFVLLEDGAEVDQGDVSIHARSVVARVERIGRAERPSFRLEIYAETDVRDPADPGRVHREVRTRMLARGVELDANTPGGRHDLAKPPPGIPILARAFPREPRGPTALAEAPAQARAPVETSTRRPPPAATGEDAPAVERRPIVVDLSPTGAVTLMPSTGDDQVLRTQATGGEQGFPDGFSTMPRPDRDPPVRRPGEDDPLPLVPEPIPIGPGDAPMISAPPSTLLPLPDGTERTPQGPVAPGGPDNDTIVLPGSQRVTTIYPRGLGKIEFETLKVQPDGTQIIIIRNGVNIQTRTFEQGIVDLEADSVVIWLRKGKDELGRVDFNDKIITNPNEPLEFYLEGHVVFRQDQLKLQGRSDQRTYLAERAYYDVQKDKLLALNAQLDLFAPNLITPAKLSSPRIFQFHPEVLGPDGLARPSTLTSIQTEKTVTTGSRFAKPGYRFTSRSIDITQVVDNEELAKADGKPFDRDDLTWQIDARQNFFFFGPVPFFYYPRLKVEADDLDPPLQGISFSTNNYFGQQVRTRFDLFNLFNVRHLPSVDAASLDVDYLSARDKKPGQGIALGVQVGFYGGDLINDIRDPYRKNKAPTPSLLTAYSSYFDVFGIFDGSRDVLGLGPAVITNGPNNNADGRKGFTRLSNPTEQDFRGKLISRHMQSLLKPDAPFDEDFRVNVENGYTGRTDRNFLEQYFKHQFDTGLDLENLVYAIRQKQNQTFTLLAETNLQTYQTETQWYPKGDYYNLGSSLLGDRLTYYQHTGADYANVHTAAEVNNRTIFAYLPIDPVTNTNGTFESGRLNTAHELDLPLKLGFMRLTPYVQGQAVGWNNQIAGHAVGRIWGGAGARADVSFWKVYPDAESELLNVHGLNHKIDLVADYRDAYSNVPLNSLGVQDDLDDNAYEYTRRYFALTNYGGGVLPPQYDPRFLLLRRAVSPITGSTDIQASMNTLKLGIHQRLQTKRGQEGKRHILDYMVFDLDTTYYPQAARDNFGKPFGQNTYNYEWYIGDRTSIVSYGWFEFWKVTGDPYYQNTNRLRNDPFGLHIVTSGLSITRIPKGNIFIGYTIVNTGPISTSALQASYSYWMSPKYFSTAGTVYDFGTGYLLGASGSITRIGADYLTSVGLTVSPLQHSYQFVFEITPRLSPNIKLGSGSQLTRLDPRFAPVD